MDQSHATAQGFHTLQHSQQPRSMIQQQHSHSPRQPSHPPITTSSQGPGSYIASHSSTTSLPTQQYQSPYIGSVPTISHHHPGETTFFGAHPSPYSSHSAAGSYASSESGENMTAQAAMNRPQYPAVSSYQTPQSNSPASIHSPQTDGNGRPLYAMSSMPQQMYYPNPYQMQQPAYPHHHSTSHHPMTSAPPPLLPYQQAHAAPQQHHQQSHHQAQPSHPGMIDTKPPMQSMQRPSPHIGPPQGTPQTPNPSSAGTMGQHQAHSVAGANATTTPGPIPATTPLVVRQDHNGVQWIAFEYSRDRVKMQYTIRCDVESVNTDELSPEFKQLNCVYPRACVNKEQYKGNRLHYESECNTVGWALAQLNPSLREKRGLIQRAVDSWRNSNQDVKLRSRRVRRQAKVQTRKTPGPNSAMQHPGAQLPGVGHHIPQGSHDYSNAPVHHHQQPKREDSMVSNSASTPRVTQNFYPTYPQHSSAGSGPMPSMISPMYPTGSSLSTAAKEEDDEDSRKRTLFGDVPEAKRRKFILVDDAQRNTRVRVRVSLDQVKMDDMPDAHLKTNSVYPRSYYPRQSGSPTEASQARDAWAEDDDDTEGVAGCAPTRGRTSVPVPLMDGSETKLSVPRMTRSRRSRDHALNEIGYRMSWGQARAFNGRTLFLQRSIDAYRNKMRSTMLNAGQDISSVAPHFETRIGKRKWTDSRRRPGHAGPSMAPDRL